jgi:lipooligosaccharide transport system permease protein
MASSISTTVHEPRSSRLSASTGVLRQLDHFATLYRRTWRATAVSSFVSPLFYVLAMGVLLGGFIHVPPSQLEGAPTYLAFIVPGLVASQAMTTGIQATTYPVMSAIKWQRTFHAQLATPLEVRDLTNAFLLFVLFRVASTCAVFLAVMAPFGVFATWWGALLAWPASVLTGIAFGTVVFAFSANTRSEESFGLLFRLGLIPMFLFSGAFFPVSNLGPVLELLARITPLWQGVNLTRMLCLDTVDASTAALNLTYLVVLTVVGWWLAIRSLTRRLES